VNGQLYALANLPPGKGCRFRRLGSFQSRSERYGEEKIS
jgi:hypothetical protein